MKILLTGAAGFIGAKTSGQLVGAGHEVIGFDNLSDAYPISLKEWRLEQLKSHKAFSFVLGDLENKESIFKLIKEEKPDAVINLAARAGVRASIENPEVYQRTNIIGTLNLMEAMREYGIRKLVLASSSSLYSGQSAPFFETQPVDHPLSPYAASKKAAEVLAYTYHHLYQLDISILRFFTVYGPAGRPDMAPLIFCHAIAQGLTFPLFGNGEQARDFTYIDDIASGVIAALKPVGYEIINLGGGLEPMTINEVIRFFESQLGKKAKIKTFPFKEEDMKITSANNDKARDLLNWTPQINPEEGFKNLTSWYLDNMNLMQKVMSTNLI